ncbi:hypothetical protein BH09BAC5_BH09BAC5_07830 [soil metagenome]
MISARCTWVEGYGFSMDKNLNPQFTIPDLTIGKTDRNYSNYHVSLTDLHLQNGLINTDWSLKDFKMSFPDSTINTFSIDWPTEEK